eukprot:GEMP01095978.1.p2 GENE.GEMP01095978.1~~GEMP01095978.1.p2  ORF type:complete len:111 (+),score=2.91 GEMP01095978.1:126-458(+)
MILQIINTKSEGGARAASEIFMNPGGERPNIRFRACHPILGSNLTHYAHPILGSLVFLFTAAGLQVEPTYPTQILSAPTPHPALLKPPLGDPSSPPLGAKFVFYFGKMLP